MSSAEHGPRRPTRVRAFQTCRRSAGVGGRRVAPPLGPPWASKRQRRQVLRFVQAGQGPLLEHYWRLTVAAPYVATWLVRMSACRLRWAGAGLEAHEAQPVWLLLYKCARGWWVCLYKACWAAGTRGCEEATGYSLFLLGCCRIHLKQQPPPLRLPTPTKCSCYYPQYLGWNCEISVFPSQRKRRPALLVRAGLLQY